MLKRVWIRWKDMYHHFSLRTIVWVSFTVTATIATVFMGLSFYSRFSGQLQNEISKENQSLMNQVNAQITSYLRNMMKVSDALYYHVIKDSDIGAQDLSPGFQLLYETNKDAVKNIALFSREGEPLVLSPAAALKKDVDVTDQEWFTAALDKPENMHFSRPHVQNLFLESDHRYDWVISLSRAVQITKGSRVIQGVLLIDITYDSFRQLFSSISLGQDGYLYVMDNTGEIIYHPKQQLLISGLAQENTKAALGYRNGVYEERYQGQKRLVFVKTVGYTGWIVSGVTIKDAVTLNTMKSNIFFFSLFLFFLLMLVMINSYLSDKVSKPIGNLERAVKEVEAGNLDARIEEEGFYEVRHLGISVKKMARQMKKLMADIVAEHESKRKSELDTLQSQINPHFLYNTLDIIVWMIENERQQDAARAVTALARFFRISLSKGKSIIPVKDELAHVSNYLVIQKMRYKNKFAYDICIEEGVQELTTIKLIVQPLVENAIYHGMEFMDGDGEISVSAYTSREDLYISVKDNGPGMTKEMVEKLLSGQVTSTSKGSGIGVANVDERVRLYFGREYGLQIHSEPDEGTEMVIHLPKVPYKEEAEA